MSTKKRISLLTYLSQKQHCRYYNTWIGKISSVQNLFFLKEQICSHKILSFSQFQNAYVLPPNTKQKDITFVMPFCLVHLQGISRNPLQGSPRLSVAGRPARANPSGFSSGKGTKQKDITFVMPFCLVHLQGISRNPLQGSPRLSVAGRPARANPSGFSSGKGTK